MVPRDPRRHRILPRLESEAYRGLTAVHWTFCLEDRTTGWLTSAFHNRFREVLIHAGVRYSCVAPVYTLMPDHLHLMLLGIQPEADLALASSFLRKHTASALLPATYQKQAYDHVLSDEDRQRDVFEGISHYIAENPVRAGLCSHPHDYPYTGAMIPGYPDLAIHKEDYWDLFWRLCHKMQS